MKLIHCADLHLDARMTASLPAEKARERRRELLLTFERMIKYAGDNQVSGILLSGDLFDTKNISAAARSSVAAAVYQHPEITFFYLRGNHDTDFFMSEADELPENLKLFGEEWTSYFLGEKGKIVVSGRELFWGTAGQTASFPVTDPAKFHIVMLHGQVAETGVKERAQMIYLRDYKNKGIDYLALGHIHSYREAPLDSRGVWCYPGCLEGRGFDECGSHGFVLLDIDEQTGACQRQFIPFAFRTLHTVLADISGCANTPEMADCLEEILKKQQIPAEDLVKLVLTGNLDVECEKDLLYLQKRLEENYYYLKIQDETGLRINVEEYLPDASLKGEFVRTVMTAEELSEEERISVIRCGLQALSGEEAAV